MQPGFELLVKRVVPLNVEVGDCLNDFWPSVDLEHSAARGYCWQAGVGPTGGLHPCLFACWLILHQLWWWMLRNTLGWNRLRSELLDEREVDVLVCICASH